MLLALLPLLVAAPGPTIFVSPNRNGPALVRLLEEEIGSDALIIDRGRADLVVSLEEERQALRLQCTTRGGELLIDRVIDLSAGQLAAVRVAVILVQEARASVVVAAPPPPSPAAERRFSLGVSAGPALGFFSGPFTPQLGIKAAVDLDLEILRLAVDARLAGLGCCAPESPAIRGNLTGFLLLAEVDPRLFTLGPGTFYGALGVGFGFDGGTAQAKVFAGPSALQSVSAFALSGRAGLRVDFSLAGPFSLVAGGGIELFAGRLKVTLPGDFSNSNEPLSGGPVNPWFDLGLRVRAF